MFGLYEKPRVSGHGPGQEVTQSMVAHIHSACECQARLEAVVDRDLRATLGTATLRGQRDTAPALRVLRTEGRFDVSWTCPFCGRVVLRSFSPSGLAWQESSNTSVVDPATVGP